MSPNKKIILAALTLVYLKKLKEEEEKRRKLPQFWINPFLLQRGSHDLENHILKDLLWGDGCHFKNFTRMNINDFEAVLCLIEPMIKKQDTIMREAVSARNRLAITLRYLATGDSYQSLEYLSRISRKTIRKIVPEVCSAIYNVLEPKVLQVPRTKSDGMKIAEDFESIWQFPNVLGAIDGKHIRIKAPPNSGSSFYCHKGFFSVILFASVNAHGKFTFIDVGKNGRINDSTIYKEGPLYEGIQNGALDIPKGRKLQQNYVSYFFIADDAFPISKNLMKPFNPNLHLTVAQLVFNYRLSRARMIVECAFGRLAARFLIFHRPIETDLNTTELIIKTCCALHNFLTKEKNGPIRDEDSYCYDKLDEVMPPIAYQYIESYQNIIKMRENLAQYFIKDGAVKFQWEKIRR